jgi:hypothetical protein
MVKTDALYVTPAQAARELGLTPSRVRQLADRGDLQVERTPLGRLISKRSVAVFIAKRREPVPAGR